MDFFQGSLPPNFISFCLDNQNLDEPRVQTTVTTDNSAGAIQRPVPISMSGYVSGANPSPPPFPPIRAAREQPEHMAVDSSFHDESNTGVVTYIAQEPQGMQAIQGLPGADPASNVEEGPITAQDPPGQLAVQGADYVRSSTPNPVNQPDISVDSLAQLETSLSIVPGIGTDFPELHVLQDQTHEMSGVSSCNLKGMFPLLS